MERGDISFLAYLIDDARYEKKFNKTVNELYDKLYF